MNCHKSNYQKGFKRVPGLALEPVAKFVRKLPPPLR